MALTTIDFTHGVDFTGVNPATGADHNDLVDLAVPKDDGGGLGKGMPIRTKDTALDTPDVPDAGTTTKWKRYLWLRVPHSTATDPSVVAYAWNDNATNDPTLLKWLPIALSQDLIDQINNNATNITELQNINKDCSYVVSITAGISAAAAYQARVWDYTVNFNRTLIQNMGAGIIKCLIGGNYLISGFALGYGVDHVAVFKRVDAPANVVVGNTVTGLGINVNSISQFTQPALLITNATYKLDQYTQTAVADGLGKANALVTAGAVVNPVFAQIHFKRLS